MRRMIADADIFIQNLAPGATGRLGLDSATLRAAHPRLITCDISGYAPDTPFAKRKAYDLMVQAESGLASITGTMESGPSRVGVSICDIATGMTAHAQILEALIARGATGQGRAISVSLFDVTTEMMNIPYISAHHGRTPPTRMGLAHPLIAPYGVYDTRDGPILIAVQNDAEWGNFCRAILRQASLASDERFRSNSLRVTNRVAMDEAIAAILQNLSSAEAIERLEQGRIAYARVSELTELISHPAVATMPVSAAGCSIEMVAPPAIVNGQRPEAGVVPELGAHDELLRAEFGTPRYENAG